MAFITTANAFKIVRRRNLKGNKLVGEVYKKAIYLFSKYEEESLLAVQELMQNPEKYFNEIYDPLKIQDSLRYVYEEHQPSYHQKTDCPRLQAHFQNFELPAEIKAGGSDVIREFRKWFKENARLLDKPDLFVLKLHTVWRVIVNPKAINFENSGHQEFKNYTLNELEQKIDTLLKEAGRYYYASEKNTKILKRFGKAAHLGYKPEPLENNNTGISDDEVKGFLKDYNETYKSPLKRLLIEYYRVKFNPELEMAENLLEALGFRPCSSCYEGYNMLFAPQGLEEIPFDSEEHIPELVAPPEFFDKELTEDPFELEELIPDLSASFEVLDEELKEEPLKKNDEVSIEVEKQTEKFAAPKPEGEKIHRLNKVIKEFNLSTDRIVGFLLRNGYQVSNNINSKISDEAYALLRQEFKLDKIAKEESRQWQEETKNKSSETKKNNITVNSFEDLGKLLQSLNKND